MKLIRDGQVAEDHFAFITDEAPLPDHPVLGGIMVSLARFRKDREALLARNTPIGVKLLANENPELLGDDVARLSVIALDFPKFRDGRAFSWARMLRTRLGFTGEIRAVGHYLYDQINYQKRVGFNAWELPDDFTIEQFNRALTEMTNVYQPSTDGRKTIRDLRAHS
jgi:uncharacterized protein (DUF934 family)